MENTKLLPVLSAELGISIHHIQHAAELLDAGNTVPFIARYRKEMTGSMDEEKIRAIEERLRYLRNLEERKLTVLKNITDQGKLTPELESRILSCLKLQELEDLYLPFKPKRRTRASLAREKGLEPLAQLIFKQELLEGDPADIASRYIDPEKGVATFLEALAGGRDIVAEWIAETPEHRKHIREWTFRKGFLSSGSLDQEKIAGYEMYARFSEPLLKIPPHRVLAMNRGEREKALKVAVDVPIAEATAEIMGRVRLDPKCIFADQLREAAADSYHRLIGPAVEREIRQELSEKADGHAIRVFARNLKALLMTPPLKNRVILGIDPGFRTGCKAAVIDATGQFLAGETIYPHEPQKRWNESKSILRNLIGIHGVEVIAIGNGTASRETEKLAAELIAELDGQVTYAIVNEAGASVYSASPLAKKEFPDLEASLRGNISIARRLMDPLSELVKIDPKSIGVGLYQHDVDQNRLSESLDHVVESCVNAVGVDLNTASASLLKYVAGVNTRIADGIVETRGLLGQFNMREELKKVKGLGEATFLQCAGFLRIPDGDCFLDATAVHPESYSVVEKLLETLGLARNEWKDRVPEIRRMMKEKQVDPESFAAACGCGLETFRDIVASLEKPNRDPREDMPGPILRSDVLSMEDLHEGMVLKGTVRNVVDFGAFVDIGVKTDGLVHLSRISKKFVRDPLDVVAVGDVVDVKVLSVDGERGRIGLSMVLDE
jgi:protein Tex